MKKRSVVLTALIAVLFVANSVFAPTVVSAAAPVVLRVCNCEDYIDETVCSDFEVYMAEKGRSVKVEYSTFGTPENLYNDLKIANGYLYDVICPSDYMIEKMAKEGILAKIELADDGNYQTYASPYIKEIFENKITWDDGAESLSDYAVGYMWGTLGFVYDPEYSDSIVEDMNDWTSIWKADYKNKITIKDSVRDSYFLGIAYSCRDELSQAAADYAAGVLTADAYNEKLSEIFNRTDEKTVLETGEGLSALKENLFGFEVDSGKNDMVTGKIAVNFAWSGDAVYVMNESEPDKELCYAVPNTGSNVWFDGWCVPKNAAQKELAIEFIEYLSTPEIAVRNMEYIGYTSVIAGDQEFSIDYYEEDVGGNLIEDSKETVHYTGVLDWVIQTYGLETEPTDGYEEANLGYFFGEGANAVLYTDVVGRQFSTQYPTEDIINRCVVMHYFDWDANTRVNKMWENVKGATLPLWAIIVIVAILVLVVLSVTLYRFREKLFNGLRGVDRRRKKYKVVERKDIY